MASNKTPAADRSAGGPGSSHEDASEGSHGHRKGPAPGEPTNPDRSQVSGGGGERGRQANIEQNTTHKGFQQDR